MTKAALRGRVGARTSALVAAVGDPVHDENPADIAELRRTLAASELRCRAALRQIERMLRVDALRRQEALLLTEAVANAQRFAHHDELTGLPNRRLLLDHFESAVALAARNDEHVALLFIDLDRFKHVNDTLGHSVGDTLLQQVAGRLVASLRASDTACRYGGDEFVVLLPELGGKDGAVVVADNIRVRLEAPYLVDRAEITLTASFGIAMHPVDAHGYDDMLRVADLAMYRDKARAPSAPTISGAALLSLLGREGSSTP